MPESYNGVHVPRDGGRIAYKNNHIQVPDNPIIPFIEGDGTGRDIWKASVRVFDGAVQKAYNGKRRVAWYEIFAGEKGVRAEDHRHTRLDVELTGELPSAHHGVNHLGHTFSERATAADRKLPDRRD